MRLWIPLATLCTWLTSNRHVLGLAVAVNFMTVAVALLIEGLGVGLSHVVFGVGAAALVRSIGWAFRDYSMETLQVFLVGILTPLAVGFLLVLIFAGGRRIADFYHFLGFFFGASIEAMYVLDAHSSDSDSDSGSAGTRGSLT